MIEPSEQQWQEAQSSDARDWNDESLRAQLACSYQSNGWDDPRRNDYDNYDEVRASS